MGKQDYYKTGSWNVICDRCGEKFKGEQLVKEWTGFMVCKPCHEPRNIQDFLRGVPDNLPKPYYRPEIEPDGTYQWTDTVPVVWDDGEKITSE